MIPSERSKIKGNFAAASMMFIFGIDAPIMKSVLPDWINAFGLVSLRMCLAAVAALLLSFFFEKEHVTKKDKFLLILAALFGILFNQGGITIGVQYSSPIDVGIIVTTTPVIVLLLSRVFKHVRIGRWNIWGILAGMAGVLLLLFLGGTAKGSTQQNTFIGNLIVVCGMVSYGLYLTFAASVLSRYSIITLMKWIFGFAALFSLPIGLKDLLEAPAFTQLAPWTVYLRLAFSGLGATFGAFMLNMIAMKCIKGRTIAMYGYLQPLITAIIAVIAGQARLTVVNVISAIFILAGVYMATLAEKRKSN
ncbi:MAG: DMT family transporter [Bacteroidales bacterium]